MITLSLLLVFGFIFLVIFLRSEKRVPWASKLHRLNPGIVEWAEWMAPDNVVQKVQEDYLEAVNWLQDSALTPWHNQIKDSSHYLAGRFLEIHVLNLQRYESSNPLFLGVLRSDHRIDVRHFEESGARCFVVDLRCEQRMATYDLKTGRRLHTQDLGEGTSVYSMVYDMIENRWKIENFVQDLPPGWQHPGVSCHIHIHSRFRSQFGRDF